MMHNVLSPVSNASRHCKLAARFRPFSQRMGFDGVQTFDQSHAQSEPQD
jgi:hypothetical protein